jgi:hypothetical protein
MLTDPPIEDQVEVSIFGPGKGEAILVHLGYNRWIVVDSCIDQIDHTIPALEYLNRIGVDVSRDVLLVVATHAHDDHIAGISEVFRRCEAAHFVSAHALASSNFIAIVNADARAYTGLPVRSFAEYQKIYEIVMSRSSSGPGFRPWRFASETTLLFSSDSPNPTKVTALSPSDEAYHRSLQALNTLLPVVGGGRRLARIDPNELAIALWVEVGRKVILLGADVLTGPDGCGWTAIVKNFSPETKAQVVKLPHHGSITGHHDGMWTNLLERSPIALLAPFRSGRTTLPSRDDRTRICSLTSDAYVTAAVQRPGAVDAEVQREARSLGPLALNAREPWGRVGHVRARSRDDDAAWTVELSPPARPLCGKKRGAPHS